METLVFIAVAVVLGLVCFFIAIYVSGPKPEANVIRHGPPTKEDFDTLDDVMEKLETSQDEGYKLYQELFSVDNTNTRVVPGIIAPSQNFEIVTIAPPSVSAPVKKKTNKKKKKNRKNRK